MRKLILAFLAFAIALFAANIKLYLKDGSYHLVREYKVQTDRVRFYSVERGDWEEMPLDLVDIPRTEKETATRQQELERDAKSFAEEEKVQRAMEREIMRIPQNPGAYWVENDKAVVMKAAEVSVHTNKGRSVLAKLSPIPAVSGKGTLEIPNAHATLVFSNPEQEFYLQLSDPERFGIAKLTPKGAIRIVENLTFVPVTKDVVEEPTMVEVFQQQLTPDGLYKIWPKAAMEPGEYAVVQFTEGKMNMQVFDFAIKPAK
jgi:hypothetical protein